MLLTILKVFCLSKQALNENLQRSTEKLVHQNIIIQKQMPVGRTTVLKEPFGTFELGQQQQLSIRLPR